MRSIGALAQMAGCSVQTIRWYEASGLMATPPRSAGNHRIYGDDAIRRLAFIRHARELGFPLDAIRELLTLGADPDGDCARADAIAARHVAEIDARIARLTALRTEVARMVERCDADRIAGCRVMEVLADHSHARCVTGEHQTGATGDGLVPGAA